jgi:hypothetical protein
MADYSLTTLFSGISVLIGLIGLYFVVRIWIRWQRMDIDIIKAHVFLDKKFLIKNWQYTFLSGSSHATHQFLDLIISLNYIPRTPLLEEISSIMELMVLGFLVILAYEWYKMICQKK